MSPRHLAAGRGLRAAAAPACLGLLAGGAPGQVTLVENAANSGLVALHDPVEQAIPGHEEWMTSGLAVGDFDNDGDQDLFWISGGGSGPDKLFINEGDGTFTDQAGAWGLTDLHTGSGAAVGDFNGDGFLDIYVTSFGAVDDLNGSPGFNRLYRNNGGTSFTEVAAEAGVNFSSPPGARANGFGSAFGDFDLDGDLDLFVTTWKTANGNPAPSDGNRLYRNDGDGTFTDVTATAVGDSLEGVRGFQPVFADMDGDLYPELLIAADFGTGRYYVNNGDGTFTDHTVESGTDLYVYGMGSAILDYDNDGLLDWYVTSIYLDDPPPPITNGNVLYRALGGHAYEPVAAEAGVDDGGWGWGALPVDLDHDGFVEIVEVNGWPVTCPFCGAEEHVVERAKLFYNNGDGTFSEIAEAAGLSETGQGRTVVYFDAENDGDLDLATSGFLEPLRCYRNQTPGIGDWLRIAFDTSTNPLLAPDGFGTRVEVISGGQTYHRYMSGAPSFMGTSELTVHFGLGQAAVVEELRVRWARGQVTVMTGVAVNQHLTITAPGPGDLDADGLVGITDFLGLLQRWGPVEGPQDLPADLDNDGTVGVVDLLGLLDNWT